MAKFSAVCFTVNNPSTNITYPSFVKYCVHQREKGDSGTEHFQGYAELSTRQRMTGLKKWLPTAHFEARRGSSTQARDYCMKEDSRIEGPWEHGEFTAVTAGQRTDLEAAAELVLTDGVQAAAAAYPSQFIRYHKGIIAYANVMKKRPRDEDFVPRPWQKQVLDLLSDTPNGRTILWVHETRGNVGKSRLATHLVAEHGAIELHGKVADMAHGYNDNPVVIFDLARTQSECVKHIYEFAEKLKNGRFFSPKYESGMKTFAPPHVVFFANFAPPRDAWSTDRLHEINLNNPLQDLVGMFL